MYTLIVVISFILLNFAFLYGCFLFSFHEYSKAILLMGIAIVCGVILIKKLISNSKVELQRFKEEREREQQRLKEEREKEQKRREEEREKEQKRREEELRVKFREECVSQGCTDMKIEKNRIRAELIAEKYGIKYDHGIEKLVKQELEIYENQERIKKQKALEEVLSYLREKERKEINKLNAYSRYYGRQKKIAILNDLLKPLLSEFDKYNSEAKKWQGLHDDAYNAALSIGSGASTIKEKDWAILGGIADGIAGPGAGIVTALEIQEENRRIREHNEYMRTQGVKNCINNSIYALSKSTDAKTEARHRERQIDEIKIQIDNERTKLLSDMPGDEVIKLLSITQRKSLYQKLAPLQ